jgi:transposase
MSRAYSEDLRDRVLDAVASGSSARGAAARFGIGVATAVRWVRRWREPGERRAQRQGYPKRSILDPHEAFLLGLVDEQSDITLDEMCARLREERGVRVARVTVWRFFERRGWSFKKRLAMPTSRRERTLPKRGAPGSRHSPISTPSG